VKLSFSRSIYEALSGKKYDQEIGLTYLHAQVEYIEAVLGGYFTAPAREAAQHLRSLLWEKVFEFFGDTSDPVHARRSTRGSDDGSAIDGSSNLSLSAEDIQVRFYLFEIISSFTCAVKDYSQFYQEDDGELFVIDRLLLNKS
jgi:hypothetical protein